MPPPRFFTVLLGIKFKIYIVKKSDYAPIIFFVAVSERFCKEAHYALDCQRVLNVERLFVVFFKKRECFLARKRACSHVFCPFLFFKQIISQAKRKSIGFLSYFKMCLR